MTSKILETPASTLDSFAAKARAAAMFGFERAETRTTLITAIGNGRSCAI